MAFSFAQLVGKGSKYVNTASRFYSTAKTYSAYGSRFSNISSRSPGLTTSLSNNFKNGAKATGGQVVNSINRATTIVKNTHQNIKRQIMGVNKKIINTITNLKIPSFPRNPRQNIKRQIMGVNKKIINTITNPKIPSFPRNPFGGFFGF